MYGTASNINKSHESIFISMNDGVRKVMLPCLFTEDRVKKYCNSNIFLTNETDSTELISQGFIHNPGYPRFYSGHIECHWRIIVPLEQRIELAILDLSVIGIKDRKMEKKAES